MANTKNKKKRKVRVDSNGFAYISSTFNNIIISMTNSSGEVISWSSAGKQGFRGSKKNTPYAGQVAAEDCAKVAFEAGLRGLVVSPYSVIILDKEKCVQIAEANNFFILAEETTN